MATAFNLTAQINLRGPSNVRNIVSDIRRQLGTVSADVNVRINPANARNITALNRSLTDLNNNLAATVNNANNAANAIRQFGAAITSIGNTAAGLNRNLGNTATAANNAAAGMRNAATNTNAASSEMVEFGRTAGLAVRRFAAFSLSAGAIMGLTNAIRKGVDAFIEYDRQFVKLQQVTGESSAGLSQLAKTISGLSTSLGVSSNELTSVSLTLAQAGLTARDTERALKALALSSLAPSFDNMNQTVEGSIALMRQFGISANDLEKSLGAVNAVSAKFAVEASDIIAAIQRTGGVFASASKGVSEGTDALNEFIAVFTSVRATTRESAETIATGLRTIFTRIQRGGTIEALKEFGVNLTDAEGKFVGAYKAVQLLSEGLNKIDPRDLKFSQIVEELGGFRQIGKVIPLIQQFATAQDALRVAQQGQGSLAADAAKAQASLANQAAKVREEFLALFREIGGSDTFQALAKGALSLASALISVADSVKGVLPVLAIMMAFRGASGLRQFGTGFLRGLRPAQGAKFGGRIGKYKLGGDVDVPVALTPGEAVIFPEYAAKIGTSTLRRMNYADKRQKRAKGGKIGIVPGQGNSDSFYTSLPAGSFVIRKAATQAIGPSNIADIASGRKKFAKGGLAVLKSSRPYVPNVESTYDKAQGESIEKAIKRRSSPPLRFNLRDTIEANIRRVPIVLSAQDIERAQKLNPRDTQNYISFRGATGSKGSSARGTAFERILDTLGKYKQEKGNRFSRIDGLRGNTPVEVKSKDAQVSTRDLLDKIAGSILSERSASEKAVADKARSVLLNKDPNNINIGRFLIFEDNTPGLLKDKDGKPISYRSQKEIEKTQRSLLYKKSRTKKAYGGGYIQRLMAGQYVKSRPGRKTRQILSDITMSDAAAYPASKIIGELGAVEVDSILSSAGVVGISANDFLRKYKLDPTQQQAKQLVLSKYVEKVNAQAAANRAGSSAATTSAASRSTLFGAIGMFGSAFPPEDLQIITDPEKPPITVRAFGAVLDKNKIMRKARLDQMDRNDPNRAAVEAAPIASQRAKKYSKAYLKTVGQSVQKSYVDEIIKLLDPRGSGLKAFFDFDKTLAFNTDPITEQQKLSKGKIPPMGDKASKAGMYSEFYEKASVARGLSDKTRVRMGLEKTKPSTLFRGLVNLSRQLKKKFSPSDYNKFLSRLYVVTARPQNTVGSIASWMHRRGLNIPLSNFTGVGTRGTSAADIGIAKANVIAQALGQDKGLFVDDDPSNIAAASELSGVQSFLYKKTKSSMGRATRKGLADTQGNLFEEEIRQTIAKDPAAANIWQAMTGDIEKHNSIDFPYGIGNKIATNWFNNPLLANIPVDAKRTLTGPRGKISTNITNFLKARRFAFGGMVQKLIEGGAAESGPELITHGGSRYLKDDVVKAMSEVTGKILTPDEAVAEFTKRNAKGDLFYTNYGIPGQSQKLPRSLMPYKGPPGLLEAVQGAIMQKQDRIATWKQKKGLGTSDYEGRTTEQKKYLRARGRYADGGMIQKLIEGGNAESGPELVTHGGSKYLKDDIVKAMREVTGKPLTPDEAVAELTKRNAKGDLFYTNYGIPGQSQKLPKSLMPYRGPAGLLEAVQASIMQKQDRIAEWKRRKGLGTSDYEGRTTEQKTYLRARGRYAAGGEIPIIAQEGEYVINRKSAKAIGYGNLNRLNKYHSGGVVQKFAAGSTNPLSPDDNLRKEIESIQRTILNFGGESVNARAAAIRQSLQRAAPARIKNEEFIRSGNIISDEEATQRSMLLDERKQRRRTARTAAVEGRSRTEQAQMQQIFGTEQGRAMMTSAQQTTGARVMRQNLRSQQTKEIEERTRKLGGNLSEDQKIQKIKQQILRTTGKAATDAEAASISQKLSAKLDQEIVKIKAKYNDRYKKGLISIAGRLIESDRTIDLARRQDRARNVEQTTQNRPTRSAEAARQAGGLAPLQASFRIMAVSTGRFIQHLRVDPLGTLRSSASKTADVVSGLASRANEFATSLRNSIIPQTSPTRLSDTVLAQRRDARLARTNLRTVTSVDNMTDLNRTVYRPGMTAEERRDAKINAAKAKKQALIDAGFGKGGGGTQAILAGNVANRSAIVSGNGNQGGSGGSRADRSNTMMNRAMGLAFAIPMITDMFSGGEAKTAEQARSQTLTQGASTAVGSGLMMGSMVGEMFGGTAGMIAGLGAAAFGVAKAMADAENAAREFAITASASKLESSLEVASRSLDLFQKELKNVNLEDRLKQDIVTSTNLADELQSARGKTQRGLLNFGDTGEGSDVRSQILFEKGAVEYFQAASSKQAQSNIYASMIPQKAVQAAKDYSGTAQISSQFLEQRIKRGENVKDMAGTPEFLQLTKSLSLADTAIQEQIMNINNLVDITSEEKQSRINSLLAIDGENKARKLQTAIIKQMQMEELSRSTNHLQNSLERMFQNMEQAIGRNVFELNNLSQQAELSASALSGNAKAGQIALKSINVLQNPRAYNKSERVAASKNAANMFGSESGMMTGLLQAGGTIEDTIMSTINKTIKEDPSAGNEKIGIKVQSSVSQALERLQLPPDVSAKLAKQVNEAIGQIRQKGDEKIDFGDLIEKVPQLGKVMESTRRAQEAALKALEHWQNGLNDYANSMNQMVDLQVEANSRMRRASDIQARGQMELDKVLGKEISLRDQMNVATAGVRSQTGGTTDPAAIAQNIRRLEDKRATQQSMSNTAGSRGLGGADEFRLMQDRLRNTNIALRENYDALKSMADNTEMASIAMAKINEIQQKRQAGVNMAERLVTSSPQELSQLNRAMDRLNNNMQGGINFGSSAEQRKESLDAFNMIAPFLGEKQNEMKANVLESMLMESGVGVNPMMAEVLQSLRNPEGDPEMQEAIAEYKKAVGLQELANRELGLLNIAIAKNTEETAATKLASVMSTFKFTFEGAQLSDVVNEIKTLRTVVENKPGAMGATPKSTGGIIYAAAGQLVNFQPKGTDTVPAMLTPGEFVVNRSATQKNLPLLNKINSGGYSSGGKVKYYADGGYVAVDEKWANIANETEREAKARSDYKKSNIQEKESTNTYPNIDLKSNPMDLRIAGAVEDRFTLAGTFYAVAPTKSASLTEGVGSWEDGEKLSYGSTNLSHNVNLGFGYDTTWLDRRDGFVRTNFPSTPIRAYDTPFPFVNPMKITDYFDPENPNKKHIKESDKEATLAWIKNVLAFSGLYDAKDLKIQGDKITGLTKNISFKPPSTVAGIDPRINISDKSVRLENLAAFDDSEFYHLLTERQYDTIAQGTVATDPGNIFGFSADAGLLGRYGGGELSSRIVSGIDNFKQARKPSGSFTHEAPYGSEFRNYFRNITGAMSSDSSLSDGLLAAKQTAAFVNSLFTTYSAIKKDKFDKQTEESIKLQTKISDFQNLFNNTIPSAQFNKTIEGYQSPLTVYNENISKRWSDYSGQIARLKTEKQFNFSETGNDFIRLKDLANDNIKSFAWTDAGFTPDDYNSVFGNIQENIELVKKNVNSKIEEYNKNGIQFTYRKYLDPSRLYDINSRRYSDDTIDPDIAFIEPQSPDISPFNPFSGGIIPQGSVIWTRYLDQSLTDILSGEQINFETTKYLDPALYPNIEPFTLSNAGDPKVPYNFSKFLEARQKNLDKIEKEKAISAVKSDFSSDELAKVNDAKRITLARAFLSLAKRSAPDQAKSVLPSEIKTIADIGNTAVAIASKVPADAPSDSYARHSIDAWRAAFAEIYNSKDAKLLQNLGVNMADNAFADPLIEKNELGNNVVRYYKSYTGATPELLQSLINREIMIKTGGMTSTQYEQRVDEDGNPLNVAKGDSYAFGASGQGKVEKDVTPDSWNKVRELALDPQRVFPGVNDRWRLFNELLAFYEYGKNKYGEPIIPTDELRQEKLDRLEKLQYYFSDFDETVNTSMKSGEPKGEEQGVGYVWQPDLSSFEYYATALKSIKNEEGKKNWNIYSEEHKPLLNLENGRDTLTADQVAQIIIASSSLQEEQAKAAQESAQQTATMSSGGVVYASKGKLVNYQPRGTDTVPAMLTPGEFVVNRAATQKHLPVLKAINEGHYSRGGIVKYLSDGGIIFPNYYQTAGDVSANNKTFSLSSFMGDIVGQITSSITTAFQNVADTIGGAGPASTNGVSSIDTDTLDKISQFTNRLKSVADTLAGLSAIPQEITITVTHTHNVIINGDSALNNLSPELQEIAMSSIREKFAELAAANQVPGGALINPFDIQQA